jgi:HAMP domain-containing protein/GAF domain-containing protein
MKTNSISRKIALTIVVPIIFVLLILGGVNYIDTKEILQALTRQEQEFVQDEIRSFLELQFVALDIIEDPIQAQMKTFSQQIVDKINNNTLDPQKGNLTKLREELGMDAIDYDLYIINNNGLLINTTYEKDLGINFFDFGETHKKYLLNIFDNGHFDSPRFFFENTTKRYKKYSYQATKDKQYIVEIGLYSQQADKVFDYMIKHLKKKSMQRNNISSIDLFFWLDKPTALDKETVFNPNHTSLLQKLETKGNVSITKKENTSITYLYIKNNNSKLIKGAIACINHNTKRNWDIRKTEILKFAGMFTLAIFLSMVIYLLIRPVGRAINTITEISNNLSQGNIAVEIKPELLKRDDELGKLANAMNTLVKGLNGAAVFAKEIGKGNLKAKFQLLGKKDLLGKSLVKMQQRLQKAKKEELALQEEDRNNRFITEGLATFGEVLRSDNQDIKQFSYAIMMKLVEYLKIPMGAIYATSTENQQLILETKGAVAYGRNKLFNKKLKLGESLVGRCAFEKEPIYLKEIPQDYFKITSGLGTANPEFLLIIPMLYNQEVFGVLELASFTDFPVHQQVFVKKLAESIAAIFASMRINSNTLNLLEQAKKQEEELKEKEEQLANHLEEMDVLFEEAEKREEELKKRVAELEKQLKSEAKC